MAFFEDPRLRQRWNQISHNAEAVTENAAAGIWSFQHHYLSPCFSAVGATVEQCVSPCFGDHEERARRRRDRERVRGRAEYSFDFYDDWYAEDEAGDTSGRGGRGGGPFGRWGGENWDRLLAGTGSHRTVGNASGGDGGDGERRGDEITQQPVGKRRMSYGTRNARPARRKPSVDDPTIIPSTQPIGFLGRLPFRIGGTLRYQPSAADLQDHPSHHPHEAEPLLGGYDSGDEGSYAAYGRRDAERAAAAATGAEAEAEADSDRRTVPQSTRNRSGTTGSGATSDSYRSRGDLFPSDGEGDEDAIPLEDDEFAMALDRVTDSDRSSGRTRSSGASARIRRVGSSGSGGGGGGGGGGLGSRTVSRATLASVASSIRSRLLSAVGVDTAAEAGEVEEVPLSSDDDESLLRPSSEGGDSSGTGIGIGSGGKVEELLVRRSRSGGPIVTTLEEDEEDEEDKEATPEAEQAQAQTQTQTQTRETGRSVAATSLVAEEEAASSPLLLSLSPSSTSPSLPSLPPLPPPPPPQPPLTVGDDADNEQARVLATSLSLKETRSANGNSKVVTNGTANASDEDSFGFVAARLPNFQ